MNRCLKSFKSHWREPFLRGFALFLGAFCLLNLILDILNPRMDGNTWWIDLRFLPPWVVESVLLVCSLVLLSFAFLPPRRGWRKHALVACSTILILAALVNAAVFYLLIGCGRISAGIPVPLSLLLAIGLASIVWLESRVPVAAQVYRTDLFRVFGCAALFTLSFPLLQMSFFGKTDYRRSADLAVVLGARVYADGRASDALADRVRTACELYRNGCVKKLLFSGGPGDGSIHETEGMKRLAVRLGVKSEDILVDENGWNTRATARNTKSFIAQMHASRVLVVSHFYHLPRIKMACQQNGLEVFTVPAKESYVLRQLPFNLVREVAAFWVYYLQGACPPPAEFFGHLPRYRA